jgi:hypothetical protein
MTLVWDNRNNLDLYVECPCGTQINFGNRTCPTCKGFLEKDMNICSCDPPCDSDNKSKRTSGCSLKPIEHILFKETPTQGRYKIQVKNFKNRDTLNLETSFQFQITTQTAGFYVPLPIFEAKRVIRNIDHSIVKLDDYIVSASPKISFLEHVQRYFKDWKNIREDQDAGKRITYENNLKRSWNLIRKKMAYKYNFIDNTPENFDTL